MQRQTLLGFKILVADRDYFRACETCQYLRGAGAEICGPAPGNAEALGLLSSTDRVDGALIGTMLRDGHCGELLQALDRRGVPAALSSAGGLAAFDKRRVVLTPLFGPEPARQLAELFSVAWAKELITTAGPSLRLDHHAGWLTPRA